MELSWDWLENRINKFDFVSANLASNDWNFACNLIQLFLEAKVCECLLLDQMSFGQDDLKFRGNPH